MRARFSSGLKKAAAQELEEASGGQGSITRQ